MTEKTLIEITDDLRREGYTEDYNLQHDCLECSRDRSKLAHDEFQVDKFYRLEGETNPSDEVIVYAISPLHGGPKGILINSFGIYADPVANELLERFGLVFVVEAFGLDVVAAASAFTPPHLVGGDGSIPVCSAVHTRHDPSVEAPCSHGVPNTHIRTVPRAL